MQESVIYQEIFHEGEIQGENKAIRKIALNMLKNNMSMDDIVKLTGLTLKEIQQEIDAAIATDKIPEAMYND